MGILLALIDVEVFLQITQYSYSPLILTWQNDFDINTKVLGISDYREFHSQQEFFSPDNTLIWRPVGNEFVFNSQGFRGPELGIKKKKDEFRIFALGDSNTLGSPGSESWVEYLTQTLYLINPNIKVENAGVWGYSAYQGYKRFFEILQYEPDLIFFSFGANDAHKVIIEDSIYAKTKWIFLPSLLKLKLFQLLFAISDRYILKDTFSNNLVPRVPIGEFKQYLTEIIEQSNKHGVKLILLTRPFTGISFNPLNWKYSAPEYRVVTISIANQLHTPYIDVYELFKDKSNYFIDESHFNKDGHIRMAEIIFREINTIIPINNN